MKGGQASLETLIAATVATGVFLFALVFVAQIQINNAEVDIQLENRNSCWRFSVLATEAWLSGEFNATFDSHNFTIYPNSRLITTEREGERFVCTLPLSRLTDSGNFTLTSGKINFKFTGDNVRVKNV